MAENKLSSSKQSVRRPDATYTEMCVEEWEAPILHTGFAALVTWLTLAGFLFFPTTFASSSAFLNSDEGKAVRAAFTAHTSLWAPVALCAIGVSGECYVWYKWQHNYVFLLRQIFYPSAYYSLACLINSLINVKNRGWLWTTTPIVTVSLTGSYSAVVLVLMGGYHFVMMQERKREKAIHP